MPKISIKPEFSLGSIGAILAVFVSAVVVWTNLNRDVSEAKDAGADNARDIEKLQETFAAFRSLNAGERLRVSTQLTEIRADLKYLRQAFERAERARSRRTEAGP